MEWTQQLTRILHNPPMVKEPLSRHTSIQVGGPADYLVYPRDLDELQAVLQLAHDQGIPFFVLGNGSNLLVSDEGYRGIVISLTACCAHSRFMKDAVRVGAAVSLPWLAREFARRGYRGLEFAAGIPGSLGGAIFMNAGAFGSYIAELVKEVVTMDLKGFRRSRPHHELSFSYRWSNFQAEDVIILEAVLKLQEGEQEEIKHNMEHMLKERAARHPQQPSAGSVFRNPPGGAGYLIEQAGLKGTVVGGAQISSRHGNFIINLGNATAADILSLIRLARDKVREQFGIELEPEIRVIGGNGKNRGETE